MAFDSVQAYQQAEALLRKHWHHDSFRAPQWEIIETALQGADVLAVMPTGAGKSLCYQIPALMMEGITIVVTPLISLMQDQVAGLRARGISATFISSTLSIREIDQRLIDTEFGRYRLLYIAPERLNSELFKARAGRFNVSLLAVDEAHCVSEWGYHFRPAYFEIRNARSLLGNPPIIALTATATPEVRRDIIEQLQLRAPRLIVHGFDRPNIVWSIFRNINKRSKILDVIKNVEGSGIIYAATRKRVEELATWLTDAGETAEAYHAGLNSLTRTAVQDAWIKGQTRIIVATNAFGMGIDKRNVRFVIHFEIPSSLEGYYQEAGRGGRDGQRAHAVLLFQEGDDALQRSLVQKSHPEAKEVRRVYETVCNLAQISVGSQPDKPVVLNYEALARVTGYSFGKLKNSIEILARQETWQLLPERKNRGLIRFKHPADQVRKYIEKLEKRSLARFVNELLRVVHADAFSQWWEFDMRLLEKRIDLTRDRIDRGLKFLEQRDLLEWCPPGSVSQVIFNHARSQRLPIDDLAVRRALRRAESRLGDMIRYARSVTCRRQFLLAYFGDERQGSCGKCDVCLGRHARFELTPDDEPVVRHILDAVQNQIPRSKWLIPEETLPSRLDDLIGYLVQESFINLRNPLEDEFSLAEKGYQFLQQWKPRRN